MSETPAQAGHAQMGRAPDAPTALVCPEPGFGFLDVAGDDAAAFLHGQLSSDVRALVPGEAQYSSYNTAKGRVLANLVVARIAGGETTGRYCVVLMRDLAASIRERLARYVLRSKITIADRSGEWATFGLAGDGATAALAAAGIVVAPSVLVRSGDAFALGLPDGRALVFGPPAAVAAVREAIAARTRPGDRAAWLAADVDAGVAWVVPATSELFVAQMLNWDVLGGISFRKGCYPGQEIVARMHYLGRLKERLLAFETDAMGIAAGAKLSSPSFGDQSCGTVAAAAPGPAGGSRLLAVTQLAAAAAGDLSLVDHPGARLVELPLPYTLPPPGTDPRGEAVTAGGSSVGQGRATESGRGA
ncbi:MAG TPA: folate-binding protein [Casimicrobiaceae bacterium]